MSIQVISPETDVAKTTEVSPDQTVVSNPSVSKKVSAQVASTQAPVKATAAAALAKKDQEEEARQAQIAEAADQAAETVAQEQVAESGETVEAARTIATVAEEIDASSETLAGLVADAPMMFAQAGAAAAGGAAGGISTAAIVAGVAVVGVAAAASSSSSSTPAATTSSSSSSSTTTGTSYILTVGQDSFPGTTGNDTFIAIIDDNTAANDTFTALDVLDGGAGTDTLFITADTSAAGLVFPGATVSNIENIVIRNVSGQTFTFNTALATGETTIVSDRSTADVTLTNVASGTVLEVRGNEVAAQGAFTATHVAAATSATLNITNGTTQGAIAINGTAAALTSLVINSSGANNTVGAITSDGQVTSVTINATTNLVATSLGVATNTAAQGIVVTGSGNVTLGTLDTDLITINAAASTGGISVTGAATTTSITGGQGADTVVGGATSTVISTGAGNDTVTPSGITTVSIAGGDGTDTLILTNGNQLTTATAALISGFEVLRVNTSAANAFDMGLEADFTSVVADISGANDLTISNADDGLSVTIIGDAQTRNIIVSILNATNPGTANTATLVLDHTTAETNIAVSGVDFAGLETLNIVSNGITTGSATVNSIADVDGSTVLRTINISGASDLTITDIGAGNTVLDAVNASTFTGKLVFNATNGGAVGGIAITGGSGADSITGDDGTDVIVGGAGADTINGADGMDTITLGAGADVHVIATEATLAAILASRDTVTDFTIGTDKIDYNGATANITALTGAAAFGAANSLQTHSASGNLTVNANARVVAITVEAATTFSTDGASVLDALVTGTGAGTITTAADGVVLFLVDNGTNTALYLGAADVGGANNTAIVQAEIALIATYNSVRASAFTISDFV